MCHLGSVFWFGYKQKEGFTDVLTTTSKRVLTLHQQTNLEQREYVISVLTVCVRTLLHVVHVCTYMYMYADCSHSVMLCTCTCTCMHNYFLYLHVHIYMYIYIYI